MFLKLVMLKMNRKSTAQASVATMPKKEHMMTNKKKIQSEKTI
jgi:hypothetical protein